MSERPVPLFVPPETISRASPAPIAASTVPVSYPAPILELGIATVNADGRVREKKLIMDDLGWNVGDRTGTRLIPDGIVLHPKPSDGDRIDPRHQVLVPAGPRALYDIPTGSRVVLVADPQQQLLIVHPAAFVARLLADHYAATGGLGGR